MREQADSQHDEAGRPRRPGFREQGGHRTEVDQKHAGHSSPVGRGASLHDPVTAASDEGGQ